MPHASHTARVKVSPSGTRCTVAAPQELQNLIKDLAISWKTGRSAQTAPLW
jgi:hypothetical protein